MRFGSPGRTRTCDKAVNSRLLYQLSYRGTDAREAGVYALSPKSQRSSACSSRVNSVQVREGWSRQGVGHSNAHANRIATRIFRVDSAVAGRAGPAPGWCQASPSSSKRVSRTSNSRMPLGTLTVTSSPASLFMRARATGDVTESRPAGASASSSPTIV